MCDGEPGAAGAGEGEEKSADFGLPLEPGAGVGEGIGEPFLEKGLLRRCDGALFCEDIFAADFHEHTVDVFNQLPMSLDAYQQCRVTSNDLSFRQWTGCC